jgi:hypothetical protein
MRRALYIWQLLIMVLAWTSMRPFDVHAQANDAAERFTFVAPKAPKSAVDGDRFTVTVSRWSTDSERDKVFKMAGEEGMARILAGVQDVTDLGRVQWPGGTEYGVRYARRIIRPDGGIDAILVTDRPLWVWWDSSVPPTHTAPFTVLQLRIGKDGRGEGRLAVPDGLDADKMTGIALEDSAAPIPVISDVRRANS